MSKPTPEIECLNSEVVYQHRWMTVREDKIRRPLGGDGIYGVIDKRDFAAIAAIEGNEIVLVEQYRYPVKERCWEIPQGSWEEEKLDPLELAARELREETGFVANRMTHVGHLYVANGHSNQGYNIFHATQLSQHKAEIEVEEEGLVSQSFAISEFERMIVSGIIKDATTVAVYGMLKLNKIL